MLPAFRKSFHRRLLPIKLPAARRATLYQRLHLCAPPVSLVCLTARGTAAPLHHHHRHHHHRPRGLRTSTASAPPVRCCRHRCSFPIYLRALPRPATLRERSGDRTVPLRAPFIAIVTTHCRATCSRATIHCARSPQVSAISAALDDNGIGPRLSILDAAHWALALLAVQATSTSASTQQRARARTKQQPRLSHCDDGKQRPCATTIPCVVDISASIID